VFWAMGRLRTAVAVAIAGLTLIGGLALGDADRPNSAPAPPAPPSSVATDIAPLPPGSDPAALPGSASVDLTFTLAGADPAGLSAFLSDVQDPFSTQYHRYLTAPQFESEFAPTPATVSAVEQELRADGATGVVASPADLAVEATLPVERADALLGISLEQVGHDGATPLYTAVGDLRLPAGLAGRVVGVGGLSDLENGRFFLPMDEESGLLPLGSGSRPMFITGETPGSQWFIGSDFTSAFGATDLFPGSGTPNATYPTHVAIATLLASGFNQSAGVDLPPFNPVAVDFYFNTTLGPSWPHSNLTGVPVTYANLTPPLPGGNGPYNDSTGDQIENSLDLEMAGSLAPGAPLYNFYLSGKLVATDLDLLDVADAFGVALGSALNYSYGSARLGLISGSFGAPDLNDSLWNAGLAMAAAMGVTVLISSGDQGNAPNDVAVDDDGQWPTWPATAAFNVSGVLAVGGVTLGVSGVPTGAFNATTGFELEYDANITGISSLVTWYDATDPNALDGSEGGLSTMIPEPYWQFHSAAQPAISAAAGLQGATLLGRAEPDLAFPANNTIVAYLANSTGAIFGGLVGGTSIAAPALAGLFADAIAVRSGDGVGASWSPFGYLDPTLYRMGSYYAAYPSTPTPAWIDVTEGRNYVFSAGTGWDATTGWGVPTAGPFLSAVANRTITQYVYTGPTPGLPPASPGPSIPWTEIYLVFGVGVAVALVLVLVMARPRRIPSGGVPYGAQMGSAAPFPSVGPGTGQATFLCPYCGAVRPAEPVRCPKCGAY
jgi:hypothetical protein